MLSGGETEVFHFSRAKGEVGEGLKLEGILEVMTNLRPVCDSRSVVKGRTRKENT